MYGIPAIFAVIFLVLSPLLAFSLLNRIGSQNKPQRVDLTIGLEGLYILFIRLLNLLLGYPPLYAMSAQGLDLEAASENDVANLTKWFSNPIGSKKKDQEHARMAISFINDYTTSGTPDLMASYFLRKI
jgi:hypothetical protein